MHTEFIATSQNGKDVFYDPVNSHAATHFQDTPQLKDLVAEVLRGTVLTEEVVEFDKDLGRIVGTTDLVANDPGDEIIYAKRKNRDVFTSFNKTKLPEPCSIVSLSLQRRSDSGYLLYSAWIGHFDSPAFPGDDNETPESKPYWTSHSLVWGSQEIQPGTETTVCPW